MNSDFQYAMKHLEWLIEDINPSEIAEQIKNDNLTGFISSWRHAVKTNINIIKENAK